jgi:hypothetical protein
MPLDGFTLQEFQIAIDGRIISVSLSDIGMSRSQMTRHETECRVVELHSNAHASLVATHTPKPGLGIRQLSTGYHTFRIKLTFTLAASTRVRAGRMSERMYMMRHVPTSCSLRSWIYG